VRIPSRPLNPDTGLKECSKCGKDKQAKHFRKNQKALDGLDVQCRDCRRIYQGSRRGTEQHRMSWLSWRLANIDRIMFLNARARATEKSLPFTITVADIYIPDDCPNCGCQLIPNTNGQDVARKNSPSLDRYNPELGYTPDNIWVICNGCNGLKQNMTGEEHVAFGLQLIDAFGKRFSDPEPVKHNKTRES